jgi:hypothetical protein
MYSNTTLKAKIATLAERSSFSHSARAEVFAAHAFTIIWPFIPEFAKEGINIPWYSYQEATTVKLELDTSSDNRDEWKDFYREFRDLGWERVEFKGPSADFKGIIYTLVCQPHDVHMDMLVKATLEWKITFTNCKVEQTGSKMVEVPIYAINCAGMEEAEAFADVAPEDIPVDPIPESVSSDFTDEDRDCALPDERNNIQPEDLISDPIDDGVPF